MCACAPKMWPAQEQTLQKRACWVVSFRAQIGYRIPRGAAQRWRVVPTSGLTPAYRNERLRSKIDRVFFSKPNVHVPAAAVTESRPASGSSATFPMDPAVGTGPIGTAVLDLLSGTHERSRLPSSARYRSFRAPPRILSRTMSCSSAATEKKFSKSKS